MLTRESLVEELSSILLASIVLSKYPLIRYVERGREIERENIGVLVGLRGSFLGTTILENHSSFLGCRHLSLPFQIPVN